MIAIITGTTGLVGSLLIKKLLLDNDITQIISIARKSTGLQNPKLKEIFISDLSEMPQHQAELSGDIYFCCLGTTIKDAGSQANFKKIDHDAIINFGKIAKAHNAQAMVVVSATGANASSLFFYNRVKGEADNNLQTLGLNKLVIFKPSLLVGNRRVARPAEQILTKIFNTVALIAPSSIKKRLMTYADHLADRMLMEGKNASKGILIIEAEQI
jgi:uncharacterized protein YbjT (DUF2867 family)